MKRNNIILILASIIVIAAMTVTLIRNKKIINAANKTIDRSQIPVTVTTFKVIPCQLIAQTTLPAKLKPVEEATVSVQTPGIISYLNIDFGSKIHKGQIVGAVDTKIAQLNLKSTRLTKDKFKDDYERAKDLYAGKAISEVNLIAARYSYNNTSIQAEQIQQQIENANIIAPISGIVTNRNLKAGEYVNAGTSIASVVNITKLKATVFVDETEVYFIHENQDVRVVSSVFTDKKFLGKIIYISPNGDENHNYQVDVLINNSPEMLKAGTNVSVTFVSSSKKEVVMIPKKALVADRKEPYVYVINHKLAHERKIITGLAQGDNIEVISGLSAGDEVVLSGQINLNEGSKTTVVNQ